MAITDQIKNFLRSLRGDRSIAKRNQHAGHDLAKTARDSANMKSGGPGMTKEVHGHVAKGASDYAKSFKKK